jgi:hypothetical protein
MIILEKNDLWPKTPAGHIGLHYVPEKTRLFSDIVGEAITKFVTINDDYPTKLFIGHNAAHHFAIEAGKAALETKTFMGMEVAYDHKLGLEIE